jgi:hypothetical protein
VSIQPYHETQQSNGLVHVQAQQVRPSRTQELAEWAQAAQAAYEVSQSLVQTSFVPEAFRNKPYEATAAILAGSEVGLSPMAALRAFDVIQGTAAARAMTLRAIVQSKGHEVWIEETTDTRAVVAGKRAGSTREQRSVWTIERARSLKLTGKPNWQNQPQNMLIARATSEVCRLIAADAILGLPYSVEEISDGAMPAEEMGAPAAQQEQAAAPARRTARRKNVPAKPGAPVEDAEPTGPPLPSDDEYEDTEGPARVRFTPGGQARQDAALAKPESESELADEKPTAAQNRKMHALFREAEITERDDRLRLTSIITGRDMVTSASLTKAEASVLIDQMDGWAEDGGLAERAAALLDDA